MNTFPVGTTVYLRWYDFPTQREHLLQGLIVESVNTPAYADYPCVQLQEPFRPHPVCQPIPASRLSLSPADVPPDPCTAICGHHSAVIPTSLGDYRERYRRFKIAHWDAARGHLQVSALDDFYALWRSCIALKLGQQPVPLPPPPEERATVPPSLPPPIPACDGLPVAPAPISSPEAMPRPSASIPKPTRKQLRSSGRIQYRDTIQTSIFD